MFLQDWILDLMYAQPALGVDINTRRTGPVPVRRGRGIILNLEDAGVTGTEGRQGSAGERFKLTEEGREPAARSFGKLTKEQRTALRKARKNWHEIGPGGSIAYLNDNFLDMAEGPVSLGKVPERRRSKK